MKTKTTSTTSTSKDHEILRDASERINTLSAAMDQINLAINDAEKIIAGAWQTSDQEYSDDDQRDDERERDAFNDQWITLAHERDQAYADHEQALTRIDQAYLDQRDDERTIPIHKMNCFSITCKGCYDEQRERDDQREAIKRARVENEIDQAQALHRKRARARSTSTPDPSKRAAQAPITCACCDCSDHPSDEHGRIYCATITTNYHGICDACAINWDATDFADHQDFISIPISACSYGFVTEWSDLQRERQAITSTSTSTATSSDELEKQRAQRMRCGVSCALCDHDERELAATITSSDEQALAARVIIASDAWQRINRAAGAADPLAALASDDERPWHEITYKGQTYRMKTKR